MSTAATTSPVAPRSQSRSASCSAAAIVAATAASPFNLREFDVIVLSNGRKSA
jgi:hypothetical protein